uniref:hypothetical protein n=1 Tax=Neokomagataea thailandica TaxID=661190 RepID=UPI0022659C80|nr:hypothetical protein [Neokomagataea thailandica]
MSIQFDCTGYLLEGCNSLLKSLFVLFMDLDIHLDQTKRFAALTNGVHGLSAHEDALSKSVPNTSALVLFKMHNGKFAFVYTRDPYNCHDLATVVARG